MPASRQRRKCMVSPVLEVPAHEVPWSWRTLALLTLLFLLGALLEEAAVLHQAATQEAAVGRVDINFGTEAEITALPEIGPALARAILADRPYSRVEDLERVKGISARMVEMLRPHIGAAAGRRKVDQWHASRGQLTGP